MTFLANVAEHGLYVAWQRRRFWLDLLVEAQEKERFAVKTTNGTARIKTSYETCAWPCSPR